MIRSTVKQGTPIRPARKNKEAQEHKSAIRKHPASTIIHNTSPIKTKDHPPTSTPAATKTQANHNPNLSTKNHLNYQ
jgi:hypothetical protein